MRKRPELAISPIDRIDTIAAIAGRRTAAELRIVQAIAAHVSSKTGLGFPSVETLAEAAMVTRRHVQRSLRQMEDDGDLWVEPGGRGPGDANRYGLVKRATSEAQKGRHQGRHYGRIGMSPEPGNQGTESCAGSASGQTDNHPRVLAKGLEALRRDIDRSAYTTWIEPLEVYRRGDGGVEVICPSQMHRDRVRNYYGDRVRLVLGRAPEYVLRETVEQKPRPVPDVAPSDREQEVDPRATMAAAAVTSALVLPPLVMAEQLRLELPTKHAVDAVTPGSTKVELTDELVTTLEPREKEFDVWDSRFADWVLQHGHQVVGVLVPARLCVRIWRSGRRSLRLVYRLPGAGRSMSSQTWTIGKFPRTSVDQARQEAMAAVLAIAAGLHVRDCATRRTTARGAPEGAVQQLRLEFGADPPRVLPESVDAPGSTPPARQEAPAYAG